MESFGSIVKEARLARGWLQEHLAELTGISSSSISYIERGNLIPKIDAACKLCIVLDLNMQDVCERLGYTKKKISLENGMPG